MGKGSNNRGGGGGRNEDEAGRKAKEKAQTATASIKQAVGSVGNTLNRSDIENLRQDGYSRQQIGRVANQVGKVGSQAEALIKRWDGRAAERQQQGGPSRPGSKPSLNRKPAPAAPAPSLNPAPAISAPTSNASTAPAPQVRPSASYGTSEMGGWLASELSAIDTFKPDLEAKVYNSYRPADLSGQLRDAVAEANSFIDQHSPRASSFV